LYECLGGAIYSGNQNLGAATNQVTVFDSVTKEWYQTTPMMERRAYLSVAVWRNRIYAVCGEDHQRRWELVLILLLIQVFYNYKHNYFVLLIQLF